MKTIVEINTTSENETIEFGKTIKKILPKGVNLIFLNGDIGAGKTTLVKGIAKSIDVKDDITSPTYGYKKEYDGLIHYDLFLSKKMKKNEIKSLISEDLEGNLVIIEWGEKIPKLKGSATINIEVLDETQRTITVKTNED